MRLSRGATVASPTSTTTLLYHDHAPNYLSLDYATDICLDTRIPSSPLRISTTYTYENMDTRDGRHHEGGRRAGMRRFRGGRKD